MAFGRAGFPPHSHKTKNLDFMVFGKRGRLYTEESCGCAISLLGTPILISSQTPETKTKHSGKLQGSIFWNLEVLPEGPAEMKKWRRVLRTMCVMTMGICSSPFHYIAEGILSEFRKYEW